VQALGEVATVAGADNAHMPNAGDEQPYDPDTFPWTDAAHWYAGGGPDELVGDEAGSVSSVVVEELFAQVPEVQLGSRGARGWCGLLRHDDRPGGAILRQNQYGRRWAWLTDADDDLAEAWDTARQEHAAYLAATGIRTSRTGADSSPRIWVG